MTAAPPLPAPTAPDLSADRSTRRRRRLRATRTMVGISAGSHLLPAAGHRRRQRLQVCNAANLLTALGVRVQVFAPATPWPAAGAMS